MSQPTASSKKTRDWIIPPRSLLWVVLGLVVYVTVANATGLWLFTPQLPGDLNIEHRLAECACLWTVVCSVWLGIRLHRKHPTSPDARFWHIAIVPLMSGAWFFARNLWEAYHPGWSADPLLFSLQVPLVILPLVAAGVGVGYLWLLSFFCKKVRPKGICQQCGYDLRGTTASRCSECGTQIPADGTTGLWINVRRYPEVLLFETAEQRDEALRSCHKQCLRNPIVLLPFLASIVLLIVSDAANGASLGQMNWPVLGVVVVLLAISSLAQTQLFRRLLRQRLLDAGIRVCMRCGQDLREASAGKCPGCGA